MSDVRRIVWSGVCRCGHGHLAHHGQHTYSEWVATVWGMSRAPGACLAFGCNEYEGDDEIGNEHCGRYVDREDPNLRVWESWQGTVRQPGRRPLNIKIYRALLELAEAVPALERPLMWLIDRIYKNAH